jgi:hypothetical protein
MRRMRSVCGRVEAVELKPVFLQEFTQLANGLRRSVVEMECAAKNFDARNAGARDFRKQRGREWLVLIEIR